MLLEPAANRSCGHYATIPVAKDAIAIAIAHFAQQAAQFLSMTMDVANDVVLARDHDLLSLWSRHNSSQRCFA
jgi:hypothetical protein